MLKLYNSLTNKKEEFKSIHPGRVGMYSCGPTVYDRVHIGNLRAFLLPDLVQRVLRFLEHKDVEWVMNITDIDDKMINKSKEQYKDLNPVAALEALADKYEELFLKDLEKVGILRDDISHLPRATDFVSQMKEIIINLLDEGIAYSENGSIYFSVDKYKNSGNKYGKLINLDYESKSRLADDQDSKTGSADFVLWKTKKSNEPYWDFEISGENYPGRPGWHIECSAMSTDFLGKPFDIHTGGVDLKFPHHENEIAQCGGAQANYYLHNEHITIASEKMAKSLGNIKNIDAVKDPMAFRFLIMSAHYRSQMEFSEIDLDNAHEKIAKLRTYIDQLMLARVGQLPPKDESGAVEKFNKEFKEAMEDDLNTPKALAALAGIEGRIFTEDAREAMRLFDSVFGLRLVNDTPLSDIILTEIDDYTQARKDKNFEKSDSLRKKILDEHKLIVADTIVGTLVSRA
ncbi:cysteine--tRNA ligase [Candidatus Saccharibacteria bacterium]|nr:cysteine--tRNA ligase [Candidatus Saccharibacteria bacterium]